MKTIIEINQKIGQPNYGSFGAGCRFEMEIDQQLLGSDPQQILAHCKLLGDLARAAVERELDLQRKAGIVKAAEPVSGRQPGDDDDLRPGDPAYERQRPARNNRPPDNRTEDQRRESREERQRGYDAYIEETRPREDRPAREDRRSDRRGGGQGAPRNGRQFAGWINKQGDDVLQRAKRLVKSWNMPTMFIDLAEDEVADLYRELMSKPESRSHQSGNGYAESRNGNGRY